MFNFKGFSILILWILMCLGDSKPIGICKTYFSIIGIEGDSLNGQALCSRTEIPFVYFVLKCNDSNSLKCAKNVQWSALSVCDKANVHHEEIPVTTALNTIDTSEFSMELSLFIQTEDEVNSVDEFIINTKVDPNDENLKTVVDSVGRLHKTQLEVEFHRVCSLPDKLKSPRQVISYLLRNHPKRRRKRAAATLEYADPGLSELQPSVSSNNGNPYLRDPFALSKANTDGEKINGVLSNQMQTTTEQPYKQFWSKIASQFSKVNNTTESAQSITIGLRNPYVTPAMTLTPYPGTSRSRSTLEELVLRDTKLSDDGNQDIFTGTPSSRVTARFITRPAVTVPSTTPPSATSSTSLPPSTTPVATTPTTTRNIPEPQTSSTASTTTQPITTPSTTTQPITTPSTTTQQITTPSTTTQQITTPSTTSTTTTTTSSHSTASELSSTTTSIKPPISTTTEKQNTTSSATRVQSTATTSAATSSFPTTSKQTTEMVMTKRPTLKPMVDDITETTTTKEENSTEFDRITTEPSINTPLPSDETDTSASSSSSRMESSVTDTSGGDDSFWPIVAAMVIGIPSVIVFAIAITVIHKKRSMSRPRRGSSLHLHGSYVRNVAARNSISV